MGGTDGVARQLLRRPLAEVVEEVGGSHATVEERGLARSTLVDDARHDEVPQVVGLEVQAVLEGRVVLLADSGANGARLPYGG